ncbi:ribosome maturation protein [Lipomyces oligophaga]|uniref:ribosome maturation protein n=1 Tax=Lipomyces oligophaga TaxID=45792 RepID=UPI0034CF9AF6
MGVVSKVVYHGSTNDFLVIVSSPAAYKSFKSNPSSVALVDVVDAFSIYTSADTRRGSHGILDQASKSLIENEFGEKTSTDEAITKILLEGQLQETKNSDKNDFKSTNDSDNAAYITR